MSNEQHLTLVLNCVESTIQVVLGTEAGLIFTAQWQGGGQGVEQLAPLLSTAFSQSCLDIKTLERIAVVRGPGSFTGIRLGLATASGLTRSTQAKNAGLLLPHCIAQGIAPLLPEAQLLAVLTHARSNLLYLQSFLISGGKAQQLDDAVLNDTAVRILPEEITDAVPKVLSPEQVLCSLRMLTSASYLQGSNCLKHGLTLVGSGLLKHSALFKEQLPDATFLPAAFNNPTPEALLELACQAEYTDEDLEPLYLRASDAEENLPYIAKTLGLDPEQASRDLARLTSSLISSLTSSENLES